jgi:hypothetical protein
MRVLDVTNSPPLAYKDLSAVQASGLPHRRRGPDVAIVRHSKSSLQTKGSHTAANLASVGEDYKSIR